jgi:hypothetical protein
MRSRKRTISGRNRTRTRTLRHNRIQNININYTYTNNCKNRHLKRLLNYKTESEWKTTNELVGYLYGVGSIDLPKFPTIIKDNFTKSIIKDGELIEFHKGDMVEIWKIISKKGSIIHTVCIIWHNSIPYSFGFIEDDDSKQLQIISPNFMMEMSLIRQKRKNPDLNKRQEKYCELLANGKLNDDMIAKLEDFLKTADYESVEPHIITGFKENHENPYNIDTSGAAWENKLLWERNKQTFEKYKPMVIGEDSYIGKIKDREYCKFNTSRKSKKKNCMGSLDTIFQELLSCRLYGKIVIPSLCHPKQPCLDIR